MPLIYRFLLLSVLPLLVMGSVHAQTYGLHEKGAERLNEARNVAPLSVDTVFGDKISHFNGGGEFGNVDISVPGNSALPVELRRVLKIVDRSRKNGQLLGGFGDWDLDIPHLSGIFALSAGGWRPAGGTANQRCSVPGEPSSAGAMSPEDYWNGYQMHIPGSGGQTLLMNPSATLPAAAGGPYPWITKEMWRLSCKASTKNGYAGQAFLALSPNGDKYHFDWGIERSHASVKNDGTGFTVSRVAVFFLVSRIEDRFGNWVDYTYSGDKLTGISSNDGRQISLTWSGNYITSVTSSIGNWTYSYSSNKLHQVTRPDASKWTYVAPGGMGMNPPSWSPPFEDPTGCPEGLDEGYSGNYTITITAPSGVVGQFVFTPVQHWRSSVPEYCVIIPPSYFYLKIPKYNWSLTLMSKTVSGPGLPTMVWNYTYGQPDIFFGGDTKQNIISGPSGTWTRYTYGTGFNINEGQLLTVEQGGGPSNILRTQTNTYVTNAEAASQNFPSAVGLNPQAYSDQLSTVWLRPLKQTVTTQQGVNFTWQVNTCTGGKFCFNVFAQPEEVRKHSTLSGSPSRTEVTEYSQNYTLWVLNQASKVTCKVAVPVHWACDNGSDSIVSQTTYDPTWALPTASQRFGKTTQTITYDTAATVASGQRGTVKTVADGNGNTITLATWKRGIPQSILFPGTPEAPSGATQSAVVNDAGWITAVTEENGFVTGYGYDAMGRLASIVYPTGDITTWNTTTQVFQQIASVEYGIPAGHWRQTISTGNGRKVTYFDGLWRPLVTREYDTANEAGTQRFQRFTYDHAGRTTFASYPATAHNPTTGTWSEYDTLGRPTSVGQDSELSPSVLVTTTQYLTNFQTRATSPKGPQTTTGFLAWDKPSQDFPTYISHPEGAFTHIARDAYGKPEILRRSNHSNPTGGTLAVNRSYTYNDHQELCRSVEPETGATLMGYDNAGNLKWSAAGLPSGQACEDNGTTPAVAARRADRSYDGRNWLRTLAFPATDVRGNQAWTYTKDGLPATIATVNNTVGGALVTNAYSYNKRRMLVGESTVRSGGSPWAIGYGFNGNGYLATLQYPGTSGLSVDYAPNALGQPTKAGTYATGVSYFPNGAIQQFTYGNGIVHTLTQNTRGLPARSTDCTTTGTCAAANRRLDLQYAYDQHGNVANITDHTTGGKQTRGMSYDALDRLVQTTSPSTVFGTASYGYDVLDSLTTVHVSAGSQSRNHTYTYDVTTRRLSQVNHTIGGGLVMKLEYDVQGNLSCKGNPNPECPAHQSYQFDVGNRLRNVPTREINYEYDGHGRRVYAMTVGSNAILSQYANSGQLLYQENHKQSKRIDYIYLGSRLVAFRERPLATATPETLKYQHIDALGSPIAVTDASKNPIESSEYEPYGQVVNKALQDGPGYTGHVLDAATGLNYMQQRYYDPQLGVFLSVDPVTAYEQPISQFHRYRYAANNPYRFIDPDGRIQRDNNGDVIFEKTGEAQVTFFHAPVEGGTLTISWSADIGNVMADDGTKIEASRATSDIQVTLTGNDGTVTQLGAGVLGGGIQGNGNSTDCHGNTFASGQVWINNDQVPNIIKGDGYTLTSTPSVGDVGIYTQNGSLGTTVHSVSVLSVGNNGVDLVGSKGGITPYTVTSPSGGWSDPSAKLNYYTKSP